MGVLGTTFIQGILDHYFLNSAVADVGDATGLRGSSSAGSLRIAAHTAVPLVGDTQDTHEASYTGYSRQSVARTSGGFVRTSNNMANAAQIQFGKCTAGPQTIVAYSIGRKAGAGQIDWIITVDANGNPISQVMAIGDNLTIEVGDLIASLQ